MSFVFRSSAGKGPGESFASHYSNAGFPKSNLTKVWWHRIKRKFFNSGAFSFVPNNGIFILMSVLYNIWKETAQSRRLAISDSSSRNVTILSHLSLRLWQNHPTNRKTFIIHSIFPFFFFHFHPSVRIWIPFIRGKIFRLKD